MFGSWASIMSAPPQDPNAERPPPPPPTPLNFPAYVPAEAPQEPTASNAADFFKDVHRATRPDAIKGDVLRPTNLRVEYEVPFERLLPDTGDWQELLPPNEPAENPDISLENMSNGLPCPPLKKYFDKKAELLYPNETCFATVKRVPGAERVRLASYHQFYLALDDMSTYWDTSKDNYFEVEDPDLNGVMRRKYTGLRVGTGRNMPEQVRERSVRAFIEVVVWDFGLRVAPNNTKPLGPPQPRLKVRKAVFMAPRCPTHYIYRSPLDVAQQKAGYSEGPVLVTHFRSETFFRHNSEQEGRGKGELTDALRDIFCALVAAQCRSREGKTEEIQRGWWTDKPKWGGASPPKPPEKGPGSGSSEKREEKRLKRARVGLGPHGLEKDRLGSDRSITKLTTPDTKNVLPSQLPAVKGSWDAKVTYLAIGRESAQRDNIFIINSLNHHISFSRYSLSDAYLTFLENGVLPGSSEKSDSVDWYVLDLKRSVWFDLLVPEERAEALRMLWGILRYVTRSTTSLKTTVDEGDEMKS